eukprot:scaffold2193_cov171-Amphora_coffeaeformis.AAC.26
MTFSERQSVGSCKELWLGFYRTSTQLERTDDEWTQRRTKAADRPSPKRHAHIAYCINPIFENTDGSKANVTLIRSKTLLHGAYSTITNVYANEKINRAHKQPPLFLSLKPSVNCCCLCHSKIGSTLYGPSHFFANFPACHLCCRFIPYVALHDLLSR